MLFFYLTPYYLFFQRRYKQDPDTHLNKFFHFIQMTHNYRLNNVYVIFLRFMCDLIWTSHVPLEQKSQYLIKVTSQGVLVALSDVRPDNHQV